MYNFLLIDFGASRIKSAICDLDTGSFSFMRSQLSAPNCSKIAGHYEIHLSTLKELFISICDLYANHLKVNYEGIVLCSEMHGFVVLDKENRPVTNYISWKDERSLNPVNGIDTFSLVKGEMGDDFKKITGMNPRPGLPFINALHIARTSVLKNGCKIISLPEWLSLCCDDTMNVAHDTMLAGLGFYDVREKKISDELLGFFKEKTNIDCTLNVPAPIGSPSGYWHDKGEKVPIYIGVGDHQCAVLGAGNKPLKTISINIGTGSQVSIIGKEVNGNAEIRPFFDSSFLTTITHIPAGRAINEYIGFLENVVERCTGEKIDFWSKLRGIDKEDILNSTLIFDLSIFKSAWNYKNGARIENINEGSMTLENYLASLLKSFVTQYLDVIKIIDPNNQIDTYILSGGIPEKLPQLADIISIKKRATTLNSTNIDETLLGLRTLALVSAKRALTCMEAQEIYGREANIKR